VIVGLVNAESTVLYNSWINFSFYNSWINFSFRLAVLAALSGE
jgi:hypothetical protein